MIETAIVISAWRSSWPWFQRRSVCCITSPTAATITVRDDRGNDPVREVHLIALEPERAAPADEVALHLERDVTAEQEERAVGHVHDAHQAEDQREAARHDEVERGGGDAVQERDEEVLRIVDGRAERRRPLAGRGREEQHPEGRDDDHDDEHDRAEAPRGCAPGRRLPSPGSTASAPAGRPSTASLGPLARRRGRHGNECHRFATIGQVG